MDKEKFFKEYNKPQPKDFFIGQGFAQNGYYEEAIIVYQKVLDENKDDFVTLCNLGYSTMMLAIKKKNTVLLENAISQLEIAINMCDEVYEKKGSYSIAEGYLLEAKRELGKLK